MTPPDPSTVDLLDERSVLDWARATGAIPGDADAVARPLAGGVSNIVLAIDPTPDSDAAPPFGGIVVKQSLPELRVAERWSFDRARIRTERLALDLLGTLVPGHVPRVVAVDDASFAFAMTEAPSELQPWKARLLDGRLDATTAAAVGDLLGRIQVATGDVGGGRSPVFRAFEDRMPLLQGRIDPYHRTAAGRNPEVAARVEAHAQRLLDARDVLVLGDFAPKNLLVADDRVVVIDLEVAHLGDASFDPAFLLTHLVLKSLVLPDRSTDLSALAAAFWSAYRERAGASTAPERDVRITLGSLLLARVDGKSPVEYLGGRGADVRAVARRLLTDESGRSLLDQVDLALHELGASR